MTATLDALRETRPLKQIAERLVESYNDDFRLTAILKWVVEEVEPVLLGPTPAAQAAFIAATAVEPLDMPAVMAAMKQDPDSVPQVIKDLFAGFNLHHNRWTEFTTPGFEKRWEIEELLRRPEWAHMAFVPR